MRHRPRLPSCIAASFIQVALAGLMTLGLATAAEATVLIQMSVEELTEQSDLVVIAQVLDQRVDWNQAEGRIRTLTRVRVTERVGPAGAAEGSGDVLIIEQEGGFLDDWGVRVAGNAQLVPGERAVLFLLRGSEAYAIFGMEQGKYTIYSADDGVEHVTRPTTVPVVAEPIRGTRVMVERPTVELDHAPLDRLLDRVRAVQGVER